MISNDDIKKIIKDTIDPRSQLDESLVVTPRPFDLPTEFQSGQTKAAHFELYENYVKSFNKISAELDTVDRSEADSNGSQFRSLKIDETYNLNAIYLHELYFANISDLSSRITTESLPFIRLSRDWGDFDKWQVDFLACCKASRCGWAITVFNFFTQSYSNCVVDLHSLQVPIGCFPIIVMDVWQHAYYKDYLRDVKTFSAAQMKELNWRVIEDRMRRVEAASNAMKGALTLP
jgi:Fe-Mn family superoxide dismutase